MSPLLYQLSYTATHDHRGGFLYHSEKHGVKITRACCLSAHKGVREIVAIQSVGNSFAPRVLDMERY
jgi:hypothetical protein